jgi:AraC-like DNA-binding protein
MPESDVATRRPAAALQSFVDSYVGYRMVGYPAGVHRGTPARHLTLIVSVGADIDVIAQTDAAQAPERYRCVVGGLQAAPALIRHDGYQEGVAIELTPIGARALLGMPAGALWNASLELGDLVGPIGPELWERLQPAAGWAERFAACDDVLLRLLGRRSADELALAAVPAELRHSWDLVVGTGGAVGVGELATSVGWTRQHLTKRFKGEFGLSPKLAARVVRFERARQMLLGTPPFVSIAQVAASCGYFDQAHLTRDFVELAGCPPGRLQAEEGLPIVQDPAVAEA